MLYPIELRAHLSIWCRGPESNRYGSHLPQDFKSCASASSATPAIWSGRRDSNPRPPPWQGGVLPLNYFRIILKVILLLQKSYVYFTFVKKPGAGEGSRTPTPCGARS